IPPLSAGGGSENATLSAKVTPPPLTPSHAEIPKSTSIPNPADPISAVLDRYKGIYEHPDINALRLIWPAIGKKDLQKWEDFSKNAHAESVELQHFEPEIKGNNASVVCRLTMRVTSGGTTQDVRTNLSIRLKRAGQNWVINSIR